MSRDGVMVMSDDDVAKEAERVFNARWFPCPMFSPDLVLVIGAGADGLGGSEIARSAPDGWTTWEPDNAGKMYGYGNEWPGKAQASRDLLLGVESGAIRVG